MKAFLITIALMTGVIQHTAYAHSTHGMDEDTAITTAHETIPKLITEDFGFEVGQLDASWSSITEGDVSIVETDGDFYIMSATNPESKKVIFLLIGINGKILEVKDSNDF
jgi:hypothetical protein